MLLQRRKFRRFGDADRIIGLLEEKGIRRNHLIVNRLRPELVKRGDMMSAQDIIDLLGVPLIGVIPDDEAVIVATNQGQSLIEGETLPGQAYRNIVRRIAGEDVPVPGSEPAWWLPVASLREGKVKKQRYQRYVSF